MNMMQFSVDSEKCIQCGECAKVCPYMIIKHGPETYPHVDPERESMCIRCQHCLAVCKPGALSVFGIDPSSHRPLKGNLPSFRQMETLAMGRRSVRYYKDSVVEPDALDRLLCAAANAPTGVNNRQVGFSVVRDAETMRSMRADVYAALRKVVEQDALPPGKEWFAGISKVWEEKKIDVLFRGAPHLLVVSTPESGPTPQADGFIALSYFELLAQSMGLGTLWDGLANWMFTLIAPHLQARLGLPQGNVIVYCMVFGYPAVHYHRVVDHEDARLHEIRWTSG